MSNKDMSINSTCCGDDRKVLSRVWVFKGVITRRGAFPPFALYRGRSALLFVSSSLKVHFLHIKCRWFICIYRSYAPTDCPSDHRPWVTRSIPHRMVGAALAQPAKRAQCSPTAPSATARSRWLISCSTAFTPRVLNQKDLLDKRKKVWAVCCIAPIVLRCSYGCPTVTILPYWCVTYCVTYCV